MKNYKSQGHIEMVLSFAIFVGFLVFLFIFMIPSSKKDYHSNIDEIQRLIIENTTINVGRLSVITKVDYGCYDFNSKDYGVNPVEVSVRPRKYDVYFGKWFKESTPNKTKTCDSNQYEIGSFLKEDYIFYDYLKNIKELYENKYNKLKEDLDIKGNFYFNVSYLNNSVFSEVSPKKPKTNIPYGVNIEVKNIPVVIIKDNGKNIEAILKIKTWQ